MTYPNHTAGDDLSSGQAGPGALRTQDTKENQTWPRLPGTQGMRGGQTKSAGVRPEAGTCLSVSSLRGPGLAVRAQGWLRAPGWVVQGKHSRCREQQMQRPWGGQEPTVFGHGQAGHMKLVVGRGRGQAWAPAQQALFLIPSRMCILEFGCHKFSSGAARRMGGEGSEQAGRQGEGFPLFHDKWRRQFSISFQMFPPPFWPCSPGGDPKVELC